MSDKKQQKESWHEDRITLLNTMMFVLLLSVGGIAGGAIGLHFGYEKGFYAGTDLAKDSARSITNK